MNNKNDNCAANPTCKKYSIAITSFVMGEDIGMPKEELFEHLKHCKTCQKDLVDWRDTHKVMQMEAEAKTPAFKQNIADMARQIKHEIAPPMPDAISIVKIGNAAGTLWHCLGENGPLPLTALPEVCKLDPPTTKDALVWLLSEKKLDLDEKKRPNIVSLTPEEQNLYFEETGKFGQIEG